MNRQENTYPKPMRICFRILAPLAIAILCLLAVSCSDEAGSDDALSSNLLLNDITTGMGENKLIERFSMGIYPMGEWTDKCLQAARNKGYSRLAFIMQQNLIIRNMAKESPDDSLPDVALIEAAMAGNVEEMRKLIKSGANPALGGCYSDNSMLEISPLAIAVKRQDWKIIHLLIDECKVKPAPGVMDIKSANGESLLTVAVKSRDISGIQYLFRNGAKADAESDALAVAEQNHDWEIIRLLIVEYGMKPAPGRMDVDSALAVAVKNQDRKFIHLLIDECNAKPAAGVMDIAAENGESLLMSAVRREDMWEIRYLLNHGAKADAKAPSGKSAMDLELIDPNLAILNLLVKSGATLEGSEYLDFVGNKTGMTPLMIAVKQGDEFMVDKLLAAKANANYHKRSAEASSASPVAIAVTNRNMALLKKLLAYGGTVKGGELNLYGKYSGRTWLMEAATSGDEDTIRQLISLGADVNVKVPKKYEYNGMTALHLAAWKGKLEAVRLLVAAGAQTSLKAKSPRTGRMLNARGMAQENKQEAVVSYLRSIGK